MSEMLEKLRLNLGWSFNDLAFEAKTNMSGVIRAERGLPITPRTAKRIADALSRGYGREILVTDIDGLNIISKKKNRL
jgi:transcriptional regulator with XRE-family HTH domain